MNVAAHFPLLRLPFRLFTRSGTIAETKAERAEDSVDDAVARRDFLREVLEQNPNAFQSDLDVQAMMHMFPGRF